MNDFYCDENNSVLKNKLNITEYTKFKAAENYYFDLGFKRLQESKYFSMEPDYMCDLHYKLFGEMYDWAGEYRLVDIERWEQVLGGLSVQYSPYKEIERNVECLFRKLPRLKATDLSIDEKLDYITDIAVKLWHVHPFMDCNTRTLVAFINQYCTSSSLSFNSELLKENIVYFRKSLVAAAFEDDVLEVKPNKSYVLRIMKGALKDNYR